MEQKLCPKCSQGQMQKSKETHGLVQWEKTPSGTINIYADHIVPVRVWDCDSCGFIELYYQKPSDL